MALVIRYFSTTSAGAGDGTTWADRAALFSAGVWNSAALTSFAFNGSDSLECRIGPGTYTCGATLNSAAFTNAPSAANPLLLHGCDSSGNRLTPPDPNWVSAQPAWDASSLPVIATTTNVSTVSLANITLRLIKFTATARVNGSVIAGANDFETADWVVVESSANGTGAQGMYFGVIRNSVVSMSGAAYDYAAQSPAICENVRLIGVTGTSGNRRGLALCSGTSPTGVRVTAYGFGVAGGSSTSGATIQNQRITQSVFVANPGDGLLFASTASQSRMSHVSSSILTGNTGYGLNAQSGARLVVTASRLRNNTSGNINGIGNYQSDLDIETASGADADEFVDSASGDYRIKYGSILWGKGIGAGDGPATITG